jgi:putative tributyrin esterase
MEAYVMAVLRANFLSKYLGMQTNVTICLPSFGHADLARGDADFYRPGMKYQTLYLLHGGSGDDADYLHFTNITRYADEHRIAVVMPSDYNAFYTDNPHGPRYWRYIADELPQVCQCLFPLSDRPEDNFVAGLSMGGHGAMKMGIMKPESFAAVLMMSGASIGPDKIREFSTRFHARSGDSDIMPRANMEALYGDLDHFKGSVNDVWHYARLNIENKRKLPKFFITVGDQDPTRDTVIDAYHYLHELGYDTVFELVPGYAHEWDFWDMTLRKALRDWLPIRHGVIYPGH